MKNITIKLLVTFLFTTLVQAQNYNYGIVHVSGDSFKVVAIPDFSSLDTNTSTGSVDIADVGFTLMLPAGASDIQNVTPMLSGRTWNLNSYDAAFLTGLGLGDGTKDAFLLTMNPGQSILTHLATAEIDIVSFEVVNPPTSGELYFLQNSDPIALGAGNVLDSFFNADIDGPGIGAGTSDYYGGNDPEMDSYSFGTLSMSTIPKDAIQIYPNPARYSFNIQVNDNVLVEKLELFDAGGKRVKTQTNHLNSMELQGINTGVYFLKIITPYEQVIKKVVVE